MMQRHQNYTMAYTNPSHNMPRYSSSHSTSSAFSPSAQPNEDWTKISDLAERRRIQNRIAQRNYRKKIKRRLEDLEKRASSSPSPEQSHQELHVVPKANSRRNTGPRRHSIKRETSHSHGRKSPPAPLVTPYSSFPEGHPGASSPQYKRELSMSPEHPMSYPYSLPDPNMSQSFGHQPSYSTAAQPFHEYANTSPYLPSLPTTLPSMAPYDPSPVKSSHFFDDRSNMNQYNVGYTPFTSMELPMQQPYQESSLNVNDLPDEYGFHYQY